LLAFVGAHHFVHVSGKRVKECVLSPCPVLRATVTKTPYKTIFNAFSWPLSINHAHPVPVIDSCYASYVRCVSTAD
jgi:hypothetical protein